MALLSKMKKCPFESRFMWLIQLDDLTIEKVMASASARNRIKKDWGVPNHRHDRRRSDWEINFFGLMGEAGLAQALCLQPDWSLLVSGDGGVDLKLGELTVQVKTPLSAGTKNWLYFDHAGRFQCDLAALCNIDSSETAVVIRGFVHKDVFFEHCISKNFGYGDRLALHASHLFSADPLIQAVQQHHNTHIGEPC